MKSIFICLPLIIFSSIRVRISWNIVDKENLFLKLKAKLGLYHVVLTTPKSSPKNHTLTVVEMQQMPDIEKTDSRKEISCLKRNVSNGRRKICENFQTDTNKLNIVVYRYRNSLYLKDNEVDVKLSEHQSLWAERIHLLSCIDIFDKLCVVLEETVVRIWNELRQEWMFSFWWEVSDCTRE